MATTITIRRAQSVSSKAAAIACLLAGASAGVAGAADDHGIVVTAGGGYSDNANRTATNEESSAFATVGLDLSFDRQRARSRLFANGDIEYREYLDGQVPGAFLGDLRLAAQLSSQSGRFSWLTSDAITSVRDNFARPLAPGNSLVRNDFSTGPNLRIPLGGSLQLSADARYARETIESSNFDNQRLGGQVAVERLFAARRSLGVGVGFERQEFDQPSGGTSEYDREEAYLTSTWDTARMDFAGQLGFSRLKPKFPGAQTQDGLLARLSLSRKLTASSSVQVRVAREFSASGSAFAGGTFAAAPTINDSGLTQGEPALYEVVAASYRWSRPRTDVSLSAIQSRETYRSVAQTRRDLTRFEAQASRALTPKSRVGMSASYGREEFSGAIGKFDDTRVGGFWRWSVGRQLSLDLNADYAKRDATLVAAGYKELQAQVRLRYDLLRRN